MRLAVKCTFIGRIEAFDFSEKCRTKKRKGLPSTGGMSNCVSVVKLIGLLDFGFRIRIDYHAGPLGGRTFLLTMRTALVIIRTVLLASVKSSIANVGGLRKNKSTSRLLFKNFSKNKNKSRYFFKNSPIHESRRVLVIMISTALWCAHTSQRIPILIRSRTVTRCLLMAATWHLLATTGYGILKRIVTLSAYHLR